MNVLLVCVCVARLFSVLCTLYSVYLKLYYQFVSLLGGQEKM
jgi:hypothetical protein